MKTVEGAEIKGGDDPKLAAVLLYGSKSWVISAFHLRALDGFHVEAARRLTGIRPKKQGDSWVYPKLADVLRAARLRTIGDYIDRRRQTIFWAIADRPILGSAGGRRGSEVAQPAFTGGSRSSRRSCC